MSQQSLSGRAIYSILIAIILFIATQYLVVYRDLTALDDRQIELQDLLQERDREISNLKMQVLSKDRDIYRLGVRMKDLERRPQVKPKSQNTAKTTVFVITPTYSRPTQRAELIRMSHTLMLVNAVRIFWIIVEDSDKRSSVVDSVQQRSNLSHVQLFVPTPNEYKLNASDPSWLWPKGVNQRNAALQWLRSEAPKPNEHSVVYFADDDNTYDLRLFEELATIKNVGVWPVGLAGGLIVERPLVDESTEKVTGWMSGWKPERPFPIDMAGFGINLQLILNNPDAAFSYQVPRGYQESHLLQALGIKLADLEPLANKCRMVFVWHTRTERVKLNAEAMLQSKGVRSYEGVIGF